MRTMTTESCREGPHIIHALLLDLQRRGTEQPGSRLTNACWSMDAFLTTEFSILLRASLRNVSLKGNMEEDVTCKVFEGRNMWKKEMLNRTGNAYACMYTCMRCDWM